MVCNPTRVARRRPTAARLVLAAVVGLVCLAAATVPAHASAPWWQLRAFSGESVLAVTVDGSAVRVETAAGWQVSSDAGNTWTATALPPPPAQHPGQWLVSVGRPALATASGVEVDPQGPDLGAARGITSPAANPGSVIAVAGDSTVWRRDSTGQWARALLLLPSGGLEPPPPVTAVVSFTDQPLSQAIYVATAGYGVLITTDGGSDWSRADSGIPGVVNGLAADSAHSTVWAATSAGLFAHKLSALPAPPVYVDNALWWRIFGIGLVVVVAVFGALLALWRLLPRPAAAVSAKFRP